MMIAIFRYTRLQNAPVAALLIAAALFITKAIPPSATPLFHRTYQPRAAARYLVITFDNSTLGG